MTNLMKLSPKFFIFCIIGGTSFLIDLVAFNLFFRIGIPFVISRTFSIAIGLTYNFLMNKNITFSQKDKIKIKQIARYLIVFAFLYLINITTGILALSILGETPLNVNIAAILGIIVSVPFSFFASLLWTFKKE